MARAALFICCILCLATWGCEKAGDSQKPVRPVTVTRVQAHERARSMDFSVNLVPFSQTVLAFKVSGLVEQLAQVQGVDGARDIQAGDRVSSGQILAALGDDQYRDNLRAARAGLEAANAALKDARLDYGRAENLWKTQSLTKSDFDAARARFDSAKGQAKEAEANVASAQSTLSDTRLVAPENAVVMNCSIQKGSVLGPGTPAFVLARVDPVKADFGVPASLLQYVKLGQEMKVSLAALGHKKFTGKVSAVSPAADEKSRVFDVEITIPNPKGELKPGMIGRLKVHLVAGEQAAAVPAVPLSCLVRSPDDPEGYALYVARQEKGETVAVLRQVKPGNVLGNLIEILDGVRTGEMVIVKGANFVQNNEPVNIVPSN